VRRSLGTVALMWWVCVLPASLVRAAPTPAGAGGVQPSTTRPAAPVTLNLRSVPLRDAVAKLAASLGEHLSCDARLARRPATLIVKDRPGTEVKDALARAFHAEWAAVGNRIALTPCATASILSPEELVADLGAAIPESASIPGATRRSRWPQRSWRSAAGALARRCLRHGRARRRSPLNLVTGAAGSGCRPAAKPSVKHASEPGLAACKARRSERCVCQYHPGGLRQWNASGSRDHPRLGVDFGGRRGPVCAGHTE